MKPKTVWVRQGATRVGLLSVALVLSCFGDTDKLFQVVAEQKAVQVGGGTDTTVTLGRGRQQMELLVPGSAAVERTQVKVSVVSQTVRRGRSPATDNALLIEPVGTTFITPVRMRQMVPSPPVGRTYRVVVVPDNRTTFVVRSRARFVQGPGVDTEGYEQWEGDIDGSGLWGLDLEIPSDDPSNPYDAGSPDAADTAPAIACTPATAAGCGASQACILTCLPSGQGESSCVAAGNKQPGEVCTGVGQCAPGSQCFNKGCGVSVCQRYCASNAECPAGASCFTEISCPMSPQKPARICSQPCDPRGAAQIGCVAGLRCLVFPNEVPSCDCPAAQRVGGDGTACANSSTCAPGLICVNTGTPVCRPICRLDQPTTCQAGRTCQTLTNPTHVVFGACVPSAP